MNNKGFAISAVLYTLLMAFLLYLGITLYVFKSSARTIGNVNDDLIDGKELRVRLVKPINKYITKEYVDCKESDTGCDERIDAAKEYTKCVSTSTSKENSQHYWYEQTECKLNSNGDFKFRPYDWDYKFKNPVTDFVNEWGCAIVPNQMIIKIDSAKGPMFWPRDFGLKLNITEDGVVQIVYKDSLNPSDGEYKGIKVICNDTENLDEFNLSNCTSKEIIDKDGNLKDFYIKVGTSDANYIGTDKEYIKLFDFCAGS